MPNASFEDTVQCPITNCYLSKAADWYSPTLGKGLYLNSCASPSGTFAPCGVPDNTYAYQIPFDGNAYIFLNLIGLGGGGNGRYYAEAKLNDTLVAGKNYLVSLRLSLANASAYACDDIGVYFSGSYISDSIIETNLPYIPQVQNLPGNLLNDTAGWTLVSGVYTAIGNEAWMTIGNFYPDSLSNYYPVAGGAPWSTGAHVFIDSVNVSEIITAVENLDLTKESIRAYPNPASDLVTIKFNQLLTSPLNLELYNNYNQVVQKEKIINKNIVNISLSLLPNGLYYLIIKNKNSQVVKKIVKL